MPEQLPFTELLNHLFAGPVASLLLAVGIHPKYPQAPINNAVAMQVLVLIILTLLFLILRARISVDNPGALQHVIEAARGFVMEQSHEIIGHDYERYTPYLMSLGIFILSSNLIGLVAAFDDPRATPSVPLGSV